MFIIYLRSKFYIVTYLGVCDYRRGTNWVLDLLTTCIHNSELYITVHRHNLANVLSLLQSPLAVSCQQIQHSWDSLASPRLDPLVTVARAERQRATQVTGSQAGGHFTPIS
jgi:hypothetical protein